MLTHLEHQLLKKLYEVHHEGSGGGINYREWAEQQGLDCGEVSRTAGELQAKALARAVVLGPTLGITAAGMHHAEQVGVIDREQVQAEYRLRFKVLDYLQGVRDEHGQQAFSHHEEIKARTELTPLEFARNYTFLSGLGLLETVGLGGFRITDLGREQIQAWRKQQRREQRFRELQQLAGVTPQKRGHELEGLLAEIADEDGWQATPNVRSQGQEHDIIIHAGLHYFLVSCKWESELTQPAALELLESRVRSRGRTNGGILVSMSGFTCNCIEEARMKIAVASLLLFGPADVEALFARTAGFNALVESKLHESMLHRRILVDGKPR